MARKKQGAASNSDLQGLQGLVLQALNQEIQAGLASGEPINQSAIRNALQLLRDNDIRSTDDLMSDFDKLASMMPKINIESVARTCSRYE